MMDPDQGGNLMGSHCMDITGPMMPHNVQQVKAVLNYKQHCTIKISPQGADFNKYFSYLNS